MSDCLQDGPSLTKTVDKAKWEEWKPIAADMAMAFTPVGEPTSIEGWLVRNGEGESFEAVVVSKAGTAGKQVEGCTTAYSGREASAFEKFLSTTVQTKALGEEMGKDMVYKRYARDRCRPRRRHHASWLPQG
ncbi:hypothetical protein ACQKKX_04620 [Neorhizobium sp. NPDC001467]|uniref:hypothetical protein n=1 Tax=Neorhizobium sp. NPDC001467 TaxID=3390595 RepID=UPI003CFDA5AB